jgi:hypothetical protein
MSKEEKMKVLLPNIDRHEFIKWVTGNKTGAKAQEYSTEDAMTSENSFDAAFEEFKPAYIDKQISEWEELSSGASEEEQEEFSQEIKRLNDVKSGNSDLGEEEATECMSQFYVEFAKQDANYSEMKDYADKEAFPMCEFVAISDELYKKVSNRTNYMESVDMKTLLEVVADNQDDRFKTIEKQEEGAPKVYEMKWKNLEGGKHRVYFMLDDEKNAAVILHHSGTNNKKKQDADIAYSIKVAKFVKGIGEIGGRLATEEERRMLAVKLICKKQKNSEASAQNKNKGGLKL